MSDAKHTPGPWIIKSKKPQKLINAGNDKYLVVCALEERVMADDWDVAYLCLGEEENPRDRLDETVFGFTTANARLIAAAPELLEALEGLRDQQERMIMAGGADAPMDQDMIVSFAKANQVLWENAFAAIAKATGENKLKKRIEENEGRLVDKYIADSEDDNYLPPHGATQ